MDDTKALQDRVLADKAAVRLKVRTLEWPAKIEVIERFRDAAKSLRASKKVVRRRTSDRKDRTD